MSTFNKTLSLLQDLIKQSEGKPIHFGNETYCFSRQSEVTPEQLTLFEQQYNVQLPEDFRTFLLTLGACTLFEDERGFSYQFYHPEQWESYAKEIFEGTGVYLFPHILLVCYPTVGHQAGFVLGEEDQFGIFYSDIPPEYWEEDTELVPFSQWLEEEIEILLSSFL